MTHRLRLAAASALLAATSLALPLGPSFADGPAPEKKGARADNDLRVRLRVRGKKKPTLRINLKVKNRGRLDQENVQVVVHDGDAEQPVWSEIISIAAGKRVRFHFRLDRNSVGDLLVAETLLVVTDDRPEDNADEADISRPPTPLSAAERGRDLYVPLCSSCHGADGRGGTPRSDDDRHDEDDEDDDRDDEDDAIDDISRESWDEFLEAFREGEEGMPLYRDLTARDARDIVAYLRDPSAVAPPAPPPGEPPLAGETPTYTAHVKPILDASCTSCHSANFAAGGIALDTYAQAVRHAAATLNSISAGRMPTAEPLPDSEVATIRSWVEGGTPE
jgi:mono/diheme cytochrome c family protein